MTGNPKIVADNIRLMGAAIASALFDELKAFEVVDQIVEQFQRGALPIGRGAAGKRLHRYWREAPDRMSEAERRNFYATLGVPGGQPGVAANRDFQDLWLRFVSAVASLDRNAPPSSIDRIKQPARDLAANMSTHGGGTLYHAAAELRKQVADMTEILSDRDLQSAFGARDLWSVIDHVAASELGGARNTARYRTLATSAATIINWLADHEHRLCDPTQPLIDPGAIKAPPDCGSGEAAGGTPADYDLVNACEMWLAESGIPDSSLP